MAFVLAICCCFVSGYVCWIKLTTPSFSIHVKLSYCCIVSYRIVKYIFDPLHYIT